MGRAGAGRGWTKGAWVGGARGGGWQGCKEDLPPTTHTGRPLSEPAVVDRPDAFLEAAPSETSPTIPSLLSSVATSRAHTASSAAAIGGAAPDEPEIAAPSEVSDAINRSERRWSLGSPMVSHSAPMASTCSGSAMGDGVVNVCAVGSSRGVPVAESSAVASVVGVSARLIGKFCAERYQKDGGTTLAVRG